MNEFVNKISSYKPGRPIEEVASEFGLNPDEIIKLASNENALGVSPKALEAMHKGASECFRYPDGSAIKLRKKIAQKHGVKLDQVMVGNGSNEILELVGHCFMNQQTSTVISRHTFVVYKLVTQLFGARLIEVPMNEGLVHDIQSMVDHIEQNTSVIFICNPNNPTGTMIPEDILISSIEKIPNDTLIVVDEAYHEVALETMPGTLQFIRERENFLICRTFSKGYGLAGLRLGYGIGSPNLIDLLQKARQPFNVNLMAQIAGIAALDDDDFIRESQDLYLNSRKYFESVCTRLNLEFVSTTTNFMLIKVGNGKNVSQALMREGVIVRSMEGYELPDYIRITFGKIEENDKLAKSLENVLFS